MKRLLITDLSELKKWKVIAMNHIVDPPGKHVAFLDKGFVFVSFPTKLALDKSRSKP